MIEREEGGGAERNERKREDGMEGYAQQGESDHRLQYVRKVLLLVVCHTDRLREVTYGTLSPACSPVQVCRSVKAVGARLISDGCICIKVERQRKPCATFRK